MDCRKSTVKPEAFYKILSAYFKENKIVNMLIDRDGIERVFGKIKEINKHDKILRSRVTMYDETGFNIAQVIAIDDIFREDFSEC